MSGSRLADDDRTSDVELSRPSLTPDDQARYHKMIKEHFDAVWRTLRGVGISGADADDCAQQVCLVALRRLTAIEPGKERSFLLGAAVRVASNTRRGRRRSREHFDVDATFRAVDQRPNPEQQSALLEKRAMVERILETMPDDIREVFVLFELEDLTAVEIGEALDIPVGTASSRLRRAREHFRAQISLLRRGEFR